MSSGRASFELALFASASRSIGTFLGDVSADQLANRSACGGWDGREVLNHMVGTAHLFAASARGDHCPMSDEEAMPDILGDDPEAVYVMAAGTSPGAPGGPWSSTTRWSPSFSRPLRPGSRWISAGDVAAQDDDAVAYDRRTDASVAFEHVGEPEAAR
jgi:hypothetical protein